MISKFSLIQFRKHEENDACAAGGQVNGMHALLFP